MQNPSGKRRVTRREFLRSAEIVGFAALAAPWLAACGQPAGAPAAAPEGGEAAAAPAVAAVEGIKDIRAKRHLSPYAADRKASSPSGTSGILLSPLPIISSVLGSVDI